MRESDNVRMQSSKARSCDRRAITCALILAVLSSCSTPRQQTPDDASPLGRQPAAAIRVPLKNYFRGLKTANVSIEGIEYSFLVDTGGGRTAITPEVAAKLNCQPRGHDVAYRMNGESVIFRNCPHVRAMLGSFELQVAPVAVFDLSSLLPKELPRVDGVLSLDSFRGQSISLDWAGNLLIVHSAADRTANPDLKLRFATGENGAALTVFVAVRGATVPLWFLLDSGNIRGTLVSRHALEDGSVSMDADSVSYLSVGGRDAVGFKIVPDTINYDGVFGADFLQGRVVTLDLRRAPQ